MANNRFICIHGHFYQPPRENPWLERVEVQDSAYPYHDWNARIDAQSYAPNAASRILNGENKIIEITNNYSKISFNFGPTLLSWLEQEDRETYEAILSADREAMKNFSGHGSAIAQCYNHMIMPLANSRDKRTQVVWGIKDFEFRFKRKPEGMWLPETAADLETLDILAEKGITFTILAPGQASQVRLIGSKTWEDVSSGKVNPRRPYLCRLPSGRTITLFFYDGPISQNIAFGSMLDKGENFASALTGAFGEESENQLVHIATDGETYGHHHAFGDMALAYCLHKLQQGNEAKITIYAEFLEKNPPQYEAQILDKSSWSCFHGIERWRSNCGCNSGMKQGWQQEWRAPLRGALDWLRDSLIDMYEKRMKEFIDDPWRARDDYCSVILDSSAPTREAFISSHARRSLQKEEKVTVLKLLEMQRNAMLIYTSCGWFFDEISGIETVQVMMYASRAMQLAREIADLRLEEVFIQLLEQAPSNLPEIGTGAEAYRRYVKPLPVDLLKIASHFAVYALFKGSPQQVKLNCFEIQHESFEIAAVGKQKLATGRAVVRSERTMDETDIEFAVLHLGEHNVIAASRTARDEKNFDQDVKELLEPFVKSDVTETIKRMNDSFPVHYSLWDLFTDERREIFSLIISETVSELERGIRQVNEHHFSIIQAVRSLNIPLPRMLAVTQEIMINNDIVREITSDNTDFRKLGSLIREITSSGFNVDRVTLDYITGKKVDSAVREWAEAPLEASRVENLRLLLEAIVPLALNLNIWRSQNTFFFVGRQLLQVMMGRAQQDPQAAAWVNSFSKFGSLLGVQVGQPIVQ